MALIKCPECGRENVSDTAVSCPNCGYGIKEHFERIKAEQELKEEQDKLAEQQKQAELKKQEEAKRIEELKKQETAKLKEELDIELSKIDNIPYPEQPALSFIEHLFKGNDVDFKIPLGVLAVAILLTVVSGNLKSVFFATLFTVVSILAFLFIIIRLAFIKSEYDSAVDLYDRMTIDWEGEKERRKSDIISEYRVYARNIAEYGSRNIPHSNVSRHKVSYAKLYNQLKCPICGSTDVKHITATNRVISVAFWGIASGKIGKQYQCKRCNHLW